MENIHWQDVFKVLIYPPKHAIRHFFPFYLQSRVFDLSLKFRCGTAEPVSGPRPLGGSCHVAGPGVWCTPVSEPRAEMGGGSIQLSCPSWQSWTMSVCELTDIRVSQYPCLWLRFHRLIDSWLSLLFLRSPWANRTPNREKARAPWRRTLCCRNKSLHYASETVTHHQHHNPTDSVEVLVFPVLSHLISAECLQMVQDLSDQGFTQLIDFR